MTSSSKTVIIETILVISVLLNPFNQRHLMTISASPLPTPSSALGNNSELLGTILLLEDEPSPLPLHSRPVRPPKSVFIAPSINNCGEGYRVDGSGSCVKIVKVDETAQTEFWLQKLNSIFGESTQQTQSSSPFGQTTTEDNSGPLKLDIPFDKGSSMLPDDADMVYEMPYNFTQPGTNSTFQYIIRMSTVFKQRDESTTSIDIQETGWPAIGTTDSARPNTNPTEFIASSIQPFDSLKETTFPSANNKASSSDQPMILNSAHIFGRPIMRDETSSTTTNERESWTNSGAYEKKPAKYDLPIGDSLSSSTTEYQPIISSITYPSSDTSPTTNQIYSSPSDDLTNIYSAPELFDSLSASSSSSTPSENVSENQLVSSSSPYYDRRKISSSTEVTASSVDNQTRSSVSLDDELSPITTIIPDDISSTSIDIYNNDKITNSSATKSSNLSSNNSYKGDNTDSDQKTTTQPTIDYETATEFSEFSPSEFNEATFAPNIMEFSTPIPELTTISSVLYDYVSSVKDAIDSSVPEKTTYFIDRNNVLKPTTYRPTIRINSTTSSSVNKTNTTPYIVYGESKRSSTETSSSESFTTQEVTTMYDDYESDSVEMSTTEMPNCGDPSCKPPIVFESLRQSSTEGAVLSSTSTTEKFADIYYSDDSSDSNSERVKIKVIKSRPPSESSSSIPGAQGLDYYNKVTRLKQKCDRNPFDPECNSANVINIPNVKPNRIRFPDFEEKPSTYIRFPERVKTGASDSANRYWDSSRHPTWWPNREQSRPAQMVQIWPEDRYSFGYSVDFTDRKKLPSPSRPQDDWYSKFFGLKK